VVPVAFWYFSLAGGLVLFTYALWRRDPVFIIGGDRVVHLFAQPLADPWQKATLCNLWLTAGFTRS
ncbi:MAG: lipid-A-disaccharide synthase N-terminal domain-containing protein, partial [Paracoccus sp. (in: a-proteobacteria)]|nr:lipid-A-disaccharide synthase N-terminal domain-containing protein [Paracoccus sp. (in: a-proteobacteria)]